MNQKSHIIDCFYSAPKSNSQSKAVFLLFFSEILKNLNEIFRQNLPKQFY